MNESRASLSLTLFIVYPAYPVTPPQQVYEQSILACCLTHGLLAQSGKATSGEQQILNLQLAFFFFLLGSKLRSPLISLACHKYPCLLSQDLG